MAYDGEDSGGGGDDSPFAQIVLHADNREFPTAIIVFNGEDVSMLLPPSRESREIIAKMFEAAARDVRDTFSADVDQLVHTQQLTLKDVLNHHLGKCQGESRSDCEHCNKESRKDET